MTLGGVSYQSVCRNRLPKIIIAAFKVIVLRRITGARPSFLSASDHQGALRLCPHPSSGVMGIGGPGVHLPGPFARTIVKCHNSLPAGLTCPSGKAAPVQSGSLVLFGSGSTLLTVPPRHYKRIDGKCALGRRNDRIDVHLFERRTYECRHRTKRRNRIS